MALSAQIQWEIRTTGSSTNGGGFKDGASGTDWTQQDSAQYSVTDGVANGTTTLTSATANFGQDVVGNVIYVQGGTGSITAVRKEITAWNSATTITVDSSTGLTAGTGVTLKIGGAVTHLSVVNGVAVAGNKIWAKATAAYSFASTQTLTTNGGDTTPITIEGYTSTRGDDGLATFRATASITYIVRIQGDRWIVKGIKFDGNSGNSSIGLQYDAGADYGYVYNCWFDDCSAAGIKILSAATYCYRCLATDCDTSNTIGGFFAQGAGNCFDRCVAKDNEGYGFQSQSSVLFINCIAHDNALSGFLNPGTVVAPKLINCSSIRNGGDGFETTLGNAFDGLLVRNCIFALNTGYGINSDATDYDEIDHYAQQFDHNAFYSNTAGARNQVPTGPDDITCTADPFNNATGDDFSLNLEIDGGLLLRGTGVPSDFGIIGTEPSVAVNDVGAVNSGGSAASGSSLTDMRNLWRELTNERDTARVPNSVVDIYIQRGLEDLNRVAEYHYTDGSVSLTADTQEYSLPDTCLRVVWVEHNSVEIKKRGVDEWRREGIPWRQEPAGTPDEFAHYGNKLVLRPKPSGAAVAVDSTLSIRFVSTPADVSTSGPAQLPQQDWAAAVYRGAALWSACYPDSAAAVQRRDYLDKQFDLAAAALKVDYASRETSK